MDHGVTRLTDAHRDAVRVLQTRRSHLNGVAGEEIERVLGAAAAKAASLSDALKVFLTQNILLCMLIARRCPIGAPGRRGA